MKTNVYLTVDVEGCMGGAWTYPHLRPVGADRRIYCLIEGQSHGIGWLCDELDARNMKATFFAEVFGTLVFGEDETREWFSFLLGRGQDVQLHTHLNFYYYSRRQSGHDVPRETRTDDLARLAPPLCGELLDQACSLFQRNAGYRPTVFRAGNWQCHRRLLRELASRGFVIDASFNRTLQGKGSFDGDSLVLNALQNIEGLWELPLTVAHQTLPDPVLSRGFRPLDPTSMSRWEMRKVLDSAHRDGIPHVSAVFHSFSGVKSKDLQYQRLKPDTIVQRRFSYLLDYLAANPDRFQVATLADLATQLSAVPPAQSTRSWAPELGVIRPLARKVVQAANSII